MAPLAAWAASGEPVCLSETLNLVSRKVYY
jgi:hypothetical protein